MKHIIYLLFLTSTLYSQTIGDYKSVRNGSWTTKATWNVYTATGWGVPSTAEAYPYKSTAIPTNITLNHDVDYTTLTIKSPTVLIINPLASLSLTGNLIINGSLSIEADATGYGQFIQTSINPTNSGSGFITVKCYIGERAASRLMGSPINCKLTDWVFNPLDTKTFVITTSNTGYWYNNPNSTVTTDKSRWRSANLSTMTFDRGYDIKLYDLTTLPTIISVTSTADKLYTGNVTDSIKRGLYTTNNKKGWNLIRNPYTSNINHDLEATNLKNRGCTGSIWVWDGTNYYTRNASGVGSAKARYIQPFQAYWVYDTTTNSGTFIHKNAHRTLAKGATNMLKAYTTDTTPDFIQINLISKNTYSDETYIQLNDTASYGYDDGMDTPKMFTSNTSVPQLWTVLDSFNLGITALPYYPDPTPPDFDSTFKIELRIRSIANDTANIIFDVDNYKNYYNIQLYDTLTKSYYDIKGLNYPIYIIDNLTIKNRFYLYFKPYTPLQTALPQIKTTINYNVSIYSIDGKLIANERKTTLDLNLIMGEYKPGIYIIRIDNKFYKYIND